ncbi:hypothetical protein N7457_008083 [Penicillium paradoxum]|uniref:uncharacterized protein n=1 Tax=Penicillium paradoxum TaxID=176176 RepID=UPI002546D9F1|nr:uncharacterized protein N7457_008083 [Penicillium paradoxum]KAJ5773187.1 hypothetical protein N7457_008083 [Penicillium paradoxum]
MSGALEMDGEPLISGTVIIDQYHHADSGSGTARHGHRSLLDTINAGYRRKRTNNKSKSEESLGQSVDWLLSSSQLIVAAAATSKDRGFLGIPLSGLGSGLAGRNNYVRPIGLPCGDIPGNGPEGRKRQKSVE